MNYEDYIDAYYESAMTAEKLYDRFIEVALELQKMDRWDWQCGGERIQRSIVLGYLF